MTSLEANLYIAGRWREGGNKVSSPVLDPSTERTIGEYSHASPSDLEEACHAAEAGYRQWHAVSAFDRATILRKAASLLRDRSEEIARIITLEHGKPLPDAILETISSADAIEWFADEGRRAYGRTIPSRSPDVLQLTIKQGVGPVAAFSPWNFPVAAATRKIAGALAAGCSIILKGPEETPGSCVALVQLFEAAGVPAGVLNLVFGVPHEISEYLIPHPRIRKISFTGSTVVGKRLAALAGQHMKRATMELGGHSPVIVCPDADVNHAARLLAASKYRNAGQICSIPTRFLVHEKIFDNFLTTFSGFAKSVKVGNGFEPDVKMGPLAHSRRLDAMESLVSDAVSKGAELVQGGRRLGNQGYFFEPTVLANAPVSAIAQNEEPFGPIALINSYSDLEGAIAESNRLDYALAAYAFTNDAQTIVQLNDRIESGMISINHVGLNLVETPFGGIKDSGHGSEGGIEGLESYMAWKFTTIATDPSKR